MGQLSKEEYLRQREENFAEISDEELEKKEIKRIESTFTNQSRKTFQARG